VGKGWPSGGALVIEHVAQVAGGAMCPHGSFNLYIWLNDWSLPELDALDTPKDD